MSEELLSSADSTSNPAPGGGRWRLLTEFEAHDAMGDRPFEEPLTGSSRMPMRFEVSCIILRQASKRSLPRTLPLLAPRPGADGRFAMILADELLGVQYALTLFQAGVHAKQNLVFYREISSEDVRMRVGAKSVFCNPATLLDNVDAGGEIARESLSVLSQRSSHIFHEALAGWEASVLREHIETVSPSSPSNAPESSASLASSSRRL